MSIGLQLLVYINLFQHYKKLGSLLGMGDTQTTCVLGLKVQVWNGLEKQQFLCLWVRCSWEEGQEEGAADAKA